MKKASERRKMELGEVQLNLNPMMDMFAVLIPALLMMSVVVEVATVNVATPSIGGGSDEVAPVPDKPPLNLTVTITENGYNIAGGGEIYPNARGEPGTSQNPTLPIVQKSVICSRYRGTVPPPRAKNKDAAPCDPKKPTESRTFWLYDTDALHRRIVEIKDENPTEHRIIIGAEASIDFEPLADVMDATRDTQDASGEIRSMFPEVVIQPAP